MQLTHIIVIMDRSGSMYTIQDEIIGSFNRFLGEQQAEPGEAVLTYVQFDDYYEVVHKEIDIKDVQPLTKDTFVPRGLTALNDAIGKTLNTKFDVLADRTLVAIITDGGENASKEYTNYQIKTIIETKSVDEVFEFIFLAANQDAVRVGTAMGMKAPNTHTFLANSVGATTMMEGLSKTTAKYRGCGDASYEHV